jgi:hypothetical protein
MRTKIAFGAVCLTAALVVAGSLSAAHAQIGLQGIEGRIGLASLESGIGSTFVVSATADMGRLNEMFGLEFNADFWTKGQEESFSYYDYWADRWVAYTEKWTYTNFGFQANVRYDIPTEGAFRPYLYGGLGLNYWSVGWDVPYEGYTGLDLSVSGIEFGTSTSAPRRSSAAGRA